MRDPCIRNCIGRVGRAVGGVVQESRRAHARSRGHRGPRNQFSLAVETRFATANVSRTVVIVGHVLLARPQQLHRRAVGLARQLCGLHDDVGHIAAAETAPQVRHLDVDFGLLEPQGLCHGGGGESRRLGRRPNRREAILETHGAIHRLHGGMRKEGHAVFRIDDLGSRLHCGCGVAALEMSPPLMRVERLRQVIHESAAREAGCGTVVPVDLDLLQRPHRMECCVCDDCHSARRLAGQERTSRHRRQCNHLANAG